MATIDILMSTYNGERFLQEQLDSLLAQDFADWRLIVRDDGSSDATPAMLQSFVDAHPDKAVFLKPDGRNLGPSQGFAYLLERAEAPYIMFCDQDDVWLPEKISTTFTHMQTLVQQYTDDIPLLVHTDLQVVDEQLCPMAASFCVANGLAPQNSSQLHAELMMNVVTGCTVMLNQAARRMVLPIPVEAVMHDWWCALVVASFGKASFLDMPLMLYRQHGANTYGSREYSLATFFQEAYLRLKDRPLHKQKKEKSLRMHYQQGKAFYERFQDRLDPQMRATAKAYLDVYSTFPGVRFYLLWKHHLWKSGLIRNLCFGLSRIPKNALRREA